MKSWLKKLTRIAAFAVGTGIAFMGAGSIWNYTALDSALFGATGAVLGLIMALAFGYAGRGKVTDKHFDSAINDAIQTVQSKITNK